MKPTVVALTIVATLFQASPALSQSDKPTVVLVHGAFADGSSWNSVIEILEKDGYPVVAVGNPLRSVKGDAEYVADVVVSVKSPVVLVDHSYGGSVISEAANGAKNVSALVYVAAFAPEAGESASDLTGKFPGSTLGPALAAPVAISGGGKDLYVLQSKFHDQFAADVSEASARLMAATQRSVTEAALNDASGQPAWKTIPAWFIYGGRDRNIPPQAHAFMAERARSRETVVIKGASHMVMVSNPRSVARLIEKAASAD